MTRFQVAPIAHEGNEATVGVLLLLDTARTNVRLDLSRSGARWRVTNIRYAHGDLVSLLRRLAADRQRARGRTRSMTKKTDPLGSAFFISIRRPSARTAYESGRRR